jgi:hypothetical protein
MESHPELDAIVAALRHNLEELDAIVAHLRDAAADLRGYYAARHLRFEPLELEPLGLDELAGARLEHPAGGRWCDRCELWHPADGHYV